MYRFAIEQLDGSRITPALCKEDVSVWRAVGLEFKGCHVPPGRVRRFWRVGLDAELPTTIALRVGDDPGISHDRPA